MYREVLAGLEALLQLAVCRRTPGTSRMSERSLDLEFEFRWRADTWRHLSYNHCPIIIAEWLALEGIGAICHMLATQNCLLNA